MSLSPQPRAAAPVMRALYSRYLPLVRSQVERILRGAGSLDTVVQAVFLRYVAQRREASTHHDPIAHLYRISTQQAVRALRAPRRRRTGPLFSTPNTANVPSFQEVPPPAVLAGLRNAPQQDAEMLALFYLADMSPPEIGETLALPAEIVAQRLGAWARSEAVSEEVCRPHCLSWMALDRLATASRAPTAAQSSHLASCPRCALRFQAQASGVAAAAYTPLPARLRGPRTGRFPWPRLPVWPLAIGTLAVLTLLLAAWPRPGTLHVMAQGGDTRLRMAVRHDGITQNLPPREALLALQAGDDAQVHVQSHRVRWVELHDADTDHAYYAGPLPADGWLPGVHMADNRPLHLRLRLCQDRARTRCDDELLP